MHATASTIISCSAAQFIESLFALNMEDLIKEPEPSPKPQTPPPLSPSSTPLTSSSVGSSQSILTGNSDVAKMSIEGSQNWPLSLSHSYHSSDEDTL